MDNNTNNQNDFQINSSKSQNKTLIDIICELVAHIKAGITLIFYLIMITIALGVGYVVLRITVWAANTIVRAIGL